MKVVIGSIIGVFVGYLAVRLSMASHIVAPCVIWVLGTLSGALLMDGIAGLNWKRRHDNNLLGNRLLRSKVLMKKLGSVSQLDLALQGHKIVIRPRVGHGGFANYQLDN